MSIAMIELAASELGPLVEEVVFVGGATLELWMTDPAAPPPRPTNDVDVIVEVTTRAGYYAFEERLRERFRPEGRVICRWVAKESGLLLDAMPADASILGFANTWQRAALSESVRFDLPSGARIRAVAPPFLLATKLEAFAGRGGNDFLASHDWADIVAVLDGRDELLAEVEASPAPLRRYLATEFAELLSHPRMAEGVGAQLSPDPGSQARAEAVVMPRIRAIIAADG